MILFDLETKSLELVLGGAVGTELPFTSSATELTPNEYNSIELNGTSAGAVAVTIVDEPSADNAPVQLKALSIYQPNVADVEVIIQYNDTADAGSPFTLIDLILKSGETLQYIDTRGFFVIDANGQEKIVTPEVFTVETPKVAQLNPSATTLTTLYTVPASTKFEGQIVAANRGAATSIRISIAIAGAADSVEQYIAYDLPIALNDTYVHPLQLKLSATDVVRVYATLATLSFTINGKEIV